MTTVATTAPEIKQTLSKIIDDAPNTIRAYVAKEALNHHSDDPAQFFADLSYHGCQSGMVGSMIYYRDTHAFFDRHYDEIEELREGYEDSVGGPLHIQGDLKNWLAWFAFEEVVYRLAGDLGLEL